MDISVFGNGLGVMTHVLRATALELLSEDERCHNGVYLEMGPTELGVSGHSWAMLVANG